MNKYQYKVKGVDYEVEIAEVEGNIAKVNVNGIPFEVELQKPINAAKHPTMTAPKVQAPQPAAAKPAAAPAAAPAAQAEAPAAAPAAGAGQAVKAPLPGTITDIRVQVGQQVSAGDIVLVLEAMKMQNNIEAEASGKISAIMVKQGDSVMEGTVLLTIA
ncbi:biotin/lipoyl-binding protein [Prevotella sp. E15-22]|uniref:acetyl-CoA carboxylase biotin carboxyl carrier protein subunit n=1 Tax=Prevotella sp. E15-22 TaxID=2937774 RepID=UPI0020557E2F|nr:acetyl-CoA carboxylase biotin carboxyl carrier protein subunit [Prevotella sp. E15-22]UPS45792.1 biotin/lipoyl-binding protein [Prevotella sp. E15-22]